MIPVAVRSNEILNEAEMASMCDKLLKSNNTKELERFLMFMSKNNINKLARVLSILPESHQLQKNDSVLKARAKVAFDVGDFKEVYSILQSNTFSKLHHKELQDLWCNTLYLENEKLRGRPLSYVDKWYLCRQFPLPMTLWDSRKYLWDSRKTSSHFKVETVLFIFRFCFS